MTFPPTELLLAGAAPPGAAGGSQLPFVIMMVAMFAIMYFLLFRPQQKQRQELEQMRRAVKRGDRVVTTSGMHGTVTGLDDNTVTLRVADQVRITFDRASIGRVVEASGDKDA